MNKGQLKNKKYDKKNDKININIIVLMNYFLHKI